MCAPAEGAGAAASLRLRLRRRLGGTTRAYAAAVAAALAATAVSATLEQLLPVSIASFSLIFLTAVLIVAARTALGPAVATAMLGFLAYNYFFTEPRFTFEITRPDELVAVVLFLVTGLVAGDLADRLRRQVATLRATNEQSRKLLALNRRLAAAPDAASVHRAAADTLHEFLGAPVCVFAADENGNGLVPVAQAPAAAALPPPRSPPGDDAGSPMAADGWHYAWLETGGKTHGAIALRLATRGHEPGAEELQLIEAYASQVSQVLTRGELASDLEAARIAEETERLRAALLSSISHDLRTPLASMIGAASSLRDLDDQLSPADKRELLDAVLSEGHRLDRYIENLLDMTRLGRGTLALKRDWVAPADVVGAALRRLREAFPDIVIERIVPEDLPLLYVHAALIEQALFNVLENAARFSPPGSPVRIAVAADGDAIGIDVIDRGPGIPEADRERVFEMFATGADERSPGRRSGLGLAICRGMVAAHGGTVAALAEPDGGTRIHVSLPLASGAGEATEAGP